MQLTVLLPTSAELLKIEGTFTNQDKICLRYSNKTLVALSKFYREMFHIHLL